MPDIQKSLAAIVALSQKQNRITAPETRELISLITGLFRDTLLAAGHDARKITRITTKFRDAGRRSPPWKPFSQRVPGRPQDGADGNRISRWKLPTGHKFHADEVTATLVEVKYYLQAFSMNGAPHLPPNTIQDTFSWLVEHRVEPNLYLDPIQLIPIDLPAILDNARLIQSGHLIPLDRDG
ncbi:MAG: hypothetical protein HY748_01255, partial [Elusimicrobia bacterium]|nr:hypothetical protein [Elusimicrobiota bacterium]